MIEVPGIRIALSRAEKGELAAVESALVRKLGVKPAAIRTLSLRKRSIDARKKDAIQLVYTVDAELSDEKRFSKLAARPAGSAWPAAAHGLEGRPVIVGAGCAGLFCALALSKAGASPLLIERGDDASRSTAAVEEHNATGTLDPESNIQFGLGGAGTFSDGKLATGTKSPYHRLVLEALAEAGADASILYDAHPHVGSDVLPQVVTRIVEQIREAGGEVRFRTRMDELVIEGGRIAGIRVTSGGAGEQIACSQLVLATGHSARDVFSQLKDQGLSLERKTFAMGVRIEHAQADVDRALYGSSAGHPLLGAAPYKAAVHLDDDRSAFSFCMCPGGQVVSAASEPGGVCTNGASLSARDGANANAGLLANVFPDDLPGDDVLAGIELQRSCEQAAFAAGGGGFAAPAQLVGDFLAGRSSAAAGSVAPTYPRGVAWGEVSGCLPDYIADTLRAALPLMARKLPFFKAEDAVLTAVETRSSSPVRVTRGENLQSVSCKGLYPVGEGAGYAGGIMSAAADGIRAAAAILSSNR